MKRLVEFALEQATLPSVERKFGINLTAGAGVALASTGGEAHRKITLTWQREKGRGRRG